MQVKTIETYSLYEFCQAVQEAVIEGYRFDFDTNDKFPQAFGSLMTAGMVKAENIKQEPVGELVGEAEDFVQPTEQVQEEKPVVKPGRKPRG
jgi:hypothetical protein